MFFSGLEYVMYNTLPAVYIDHSLMQFELVYMYINIFFFA